jgi:hypothetical protein
MLLAVVNVAVLLCGYGAAQARGEAPPAVRGVSNLIVVDAHDRLVGSVIGFGRPRVLDVQRPELPRVVIRQGARFAWLYAAPWGLVSDDIALFETADCAGAVYVPTPYDPALDIIPAVALFEGWTYHARAGAPRGRKIQVRATGGVDGTCHPVDDVSGSRLYRTERVMDLNGRWTPPFRIRANE